MKFFKSKVPEKDRVPFWQKVAYGLGGPVEGTAIWIPQGNLTPVFNIAMGMNPALQTASPHPTTGTDPPRSKKKY